MITSNPRYWEKAVELFMKGIDSVNYSNDYQDIYKAEKYAYERLPVTMAKGTRPILDKMFGNYRMIVVKGLLE